MPRYPAVPHTARARKKIRRVLREFKHRQLYTRGGRRVTKRSQAIRIALEEARRRNPGGYSLSAEQYRSLRKARAIMRRSHGRTTRRRARHTIRRLTRYRSNPEGGAGKWVAFGLIAFGAYLLLRPTQPTVMPVGTGATGLFQQGQGILSSLQSILGSLGSWVPQSGVPGTTGTWGEAATVIGGSDIQAA